MAQMRLVRNPLVWLHRIRHRKGYGVHSPFAFQFITGVVYEQTPFYAYSKLSLLHPWWVRMLGLYPMQCHRLLFRLANYAHPDAICIVAETHCERQYIAAAVPTAESVDPKEIITSQPRNALVFVGFPAQGRALTLSQQMPSDGMLILEGIHNSNTSLKLWRKIQSDPHTGITFDLHTYGICFYDHSRTKQHYVVNF
ncbi:MAG: hypothetical protein J5486_04060 [Bacteroidaceae bacterium]|nr:hypothetical protein [Bacteroidaceae bacterium]